MAFCMEMPHDPEPPRLRLMTSAGVGLAGTPLTVPPDAQMMASAMSAVEPPQRPSTRTAWMSAFGAMPTTPVGVAGGGGDRAGDVGAVPRRVPRRAQEAALAGGVPVAGVARRRRRARRRRWRWWPT